MATATPRVMKTRHTRTESAVRPDKVTLELSFEEAAALRSISSYPLNSSDMFTEVYYELCGLNYAMDMFCYGRVVSSETYQRQIHQDLTTGKIKQLLAAALPVPGT